MHLLHKNQENFSHKKFRPTDPISKIDHFDPLFGFSDPKITEVVWVRFSIFSIFENFFKGVPPLKFSKNFPKNRKFLYFFFRNRPTSAPKLPRQTQGYQMRPIRGLKYFPTALNRPKTNFSKSPKSHFFRKKKFFGKVDFLGPKAA